MTDENENGPAEGGAKGDAPERPGIGKLAAALAKAQGAFTNPERNRKVTIRGKTKDGRAYSYDFWYAEMATILDVVRKPLADNDLAVVQILEHQGDDIVVRTMLMHASGEVLSQRMVAGSVRRDIKDVGGAITYARRYSLSAMLNIASEGDSDDDGQAAGNGAPVRDDEPRPRRAPQQQQEKPKPKPWDGKPDYKIPYVSETQVYTTLSTQDSPLMAEVRNLAKDDLIRLEDILPKRRLHFFDRKLTGMVWCCDRDLKLVSDELDRRGSEQPEPLPAQAGPGERQPAAGQRELIKDHAPGKNTATTGQADSGPAANPARVAVTAIHLDAEVDAALVKVTRALSDDEIVALKEISAAEVLAMAVHPANRELFDPAYASELATANVIQAAPLSGMWLARVWYAAHEANKERRLKARKLARLALLALELQARVEAGPPKIETREAVAREHADVAHLLSGLCGADEAAQRLTDLAKEPDNG